MPRNRNRYGQTIQPAVISNGEDTGSPVRRLADLLDKGLDLITALRLVDSSINMIPRYQVLSVTTDTTLTIDDQVVLSTSGTIITLADVLNGMSVYVKNISTSGVVTVDPGTMNIDQGAGVASTSDITLVAGASIHLLFMTDTWRISVSSISRAMKILAREGMRQDQKMKIWKAEKEIERDARRYRWNDDLIETLPAEWQWRVCCARLQMGIYDWRGWQWRNPRAGHDPFDIPKWKLGLPIYPLYPEVREPERVKSLLIYSEQGIGDQLMFAQAIDSVRPYADEVCIEVEPRLAPIFRRTFPDFRIHPLKDLRDSSWVKGEFDAKVLMGDVVARFLRKKEDFRPFEMTADPGKVKEWSCYKDRTGFSFHGRQGDLPFDVFKDGWINLQYGQHEVPNRFLTPRIDLTNDIEDIFGILANLKKVVTVANTLAHMAGVLNVPTDVIVTPGKGEVNNAINYRWGMMDARTMPWHQSITIYRNERQYESGLSGT